MEIEMKVDEYPPGNEVYSVMIHSGDQTIQIDAKGDREANLLMDNLSDVLERYSSEVVQVKY